MTIVFSGGPYDGLRMGVDEIKRHLVILSIPGHRGPRRFVYLPRPDDWPDVLAGRMRLHESKTFHYYELMRTSQGLKFRSDPDGRGYMRAIIEGRDLM